MKNVARSSVVLLTTASLLCLVLAVRRAQVVSAQQSREAGLPADLLRKLNPSHPSGAFDIDTSRFPQVTQNFTLQRARDFHVAGGPVDCPNCKVLMVATIRPSAPGAKIVSIRVAARRPTSNNHFYRCQHEASCGVPEFADPNDARLDCIGKLSCNIFRATDDGVGTPEDDIEMVSQ